MMLFLAFLHYLLFLFSRLIYAQRCAIIVNDTRTENVGNYNATRKTAETMDMGGTMYSLYI